MLVSRFKDILDEHAGALRGAERRHQRSLRVGGKAGVGHGFDRIDGGKPCGCPQMDAVFSGFNPAARFFEHRQDGGKMPGTDAREQQLPAGRRACAEVGGGFDPVGNHPVHAVVQRLDPPRR